MEKAMTILDMTNKTESSYEIWARNPADGLLFSTHRGCGDAKTARSIAEKVAAKPNEYEDVLPQVANAVQLGYKLIVVCRTTVVKSICQEMVFSDEDAAAENENENEG